MYIYIAQFVESTCKHFNACLHVDLYSDSHLFSLQHLLFDTDVKMYVTSDPLWNKIHWPPQELSAQENETELHYIDSLRHC